MACVLEVQIGLHGTGCDNKHKLILKSILLEHESSSFVIEVSGVEAVSVICELAEDLLVRVKFCARSRGYANVGKIVESLVELTNYISCILGRRVSKHKIFGFCRYWFSSRLSVRPVYGLIDVVIGAGDAGAEESESDDAHNVEEE